MKTPKIVIRLIPGFYSTTTITFTSHPIAASDVSPAKVFYEEPIYDSDGNLSSECRKAIQRRALAFAQLRGFRVCAVYSQDDCDYVEPSGEITQSTEPPSLHMDLAEGRTRIEADLLSSNSTNPIETTLEKPC